MYAIFHFFENENERTYFLGTRPPLSGKFGRFFPARTGRDPSELVGQVARVTSRIFVRLNFIAPMGDLFFQSILKLRDTIFPTLHRVLAGGRSGPLPWPVCLGKFVFRSWGRPKFVHDGVLPLCFDVTLVRSMARSELCVFVLCRRCSKNGVAHWARKRECIRKCERTRLESWLFFAAGAAGVAEGGGEEAVGG